MRIAIPLNNGNVSAHFGTAGAFLLADIAENRVTNRVEAAVPEGSGHHGLPAFLQQHGVTHVIAGGMGRPMHEHLARVGIPTVVGVSGSPEEALSAFIDGSLLSNMSAVHEHHHGHQH